MSDLLGKNRTYPTEVVTPQAQTLVMRLESINKRLIELQSGLGQTADRALGPRPTEVPGPGAPPQTGEPPVFIKLGMLVEEMDTWLTYAESNLNRLHEIV
jgi:hypothetical protein